MQALVNELDFFFADGGALDITAHIGGEQVDGPALLACARSAEAKRMNISYQKMCSDKSVYDC